MGVSSSSARLARATSWLRFAFAALCNLRPPARAPTPLNMFRRCGPARVAHPRVSHTRPRRSRLCGRELHENSVKPSNDASARSRPSSIVKLYLNRITT
ncbi:hypothetical protein EVAR_26643_1 [Eumeta japonica]|uniref:Uncharacterized protein n=1 Tax=Eumeta variegata TaxID=151549 RepID=A0A4C1VLU4_EUMVA|nr:hypothetical protein EVAR_26643_1 [Eumeta japonica]